MSRAVEAALTSTLPMSAALSAATRSWLPLMAGLAGVVLARTVFNDRINRKRRRPQTLRETLPLTGVAALVTAVVIVDHDLVLSTAAFLGLGVGWVAVLLLDVLGEWVLGLFPAARERRAELEDTPADMTDMLEIIDQRDDEVQRRRHKGG